MIQIRIEDEAARALLARLASRLRDLTPLMQMLAGTLHAAVERNFEAEGRPRWAPLASRTIRERQRKGYWPGKILQRRGQLAASITQQADARRAIVGTNKAYAAVHQLGFSGTVQVPAHIRRVKSRDVGRGKKKKLSGIAAVKAHSKHMRIPARPFLTLTEEDWAEIRVTALAYLQAFE